MDIAIQVQILDEAVGILCSSDTYESDYSPPT